MSFRNVQDNSLRTKILSNATYLDGEWVRNPSWLPLASVSSSEQKFSGLYQINRYANFIALNFTTSTGQYTVDWGDGSTPVNINSGTSAFYEYDWTDVDLNGTDAPVTFTASTSTVNRNNHGYTDGMNISFATIVTTTGIVVDQIYYVVNATTNSFQVSDSIGGTPITLTNDGSGTILPYKQVIVTVTPVSGNFTACNLTVKHNQAGLQNGYTTGWLDVVLAGNYTSITTNSNTASVTNNYLQQFAIRNSNLTSTSNLFSSLASFSSFPEINSRTNITNASFMFNACSALPKISASLNWQNFSNTASMFVNCRSLVTIPIIENLGSTDMSSMFSQCTSLKEIVINSASNVTNASGAFSSLNADRIIILKTTNLTNLNGMFGGLRNNPEIVIETTGPNATATNMFAGTQFNSAPYFDTSKIRDASNMFGSCSVLQNVPPYNLNNANTLASMFSGCISLRALPALQTANNLTCQDMFNGCTYLINAPDMDTRLVTNMQSMFQGCASLEKIPTYNTVNVTNMQSMFLQCRSLTNAPFFNTSNVTNMQFMFENCNSLKNVPIYDTSKVTSMWAILRGTPLVKIPNFNTSNVNNMQGLTFESFISEIPELDARKVDNFNSGTNVSLSKIGLKGFITPSFSISNGKLSSAALNEIYTNAGRVGNGGGATNAVTFQGAADTVTKSSHNYLEGDAVRFSTITTTTGISTNTNYYVRNPTTDTFQLSLFPSSAIINLVNDGTGAIAAGSITVSGNYGTTGDNPAIATAKGWTVTGS